MRLRVLIVEDSVDDTKLLVRALTKQGFDVDFRRVDTRESMLAALVEAPWDVILADHTMPEFSARGALDTLKSTSFDIPFIIVSGMIGEDMAIEAMKAGAHDYIMKSSMARLVPAIRRELAEATVRKERRQADEALRVAYDDLERRVQERTADLAAANEELAATNEELAATNEELAATSQELRLHQEREIEALRELDRKKDEFLSVAAHELKTPVTTVLGFAQTLLRHHEHRGSIDPERMHRGLQTIVSQAQKLGALVTQLLDMSRIESGKLTLERQSVDLVEIVRDVAAAAQASNSQQITVQAPPRVEVFVDPLRIEQVITNLVSNALKFNRRGLGPIEITVEAIDGAVDIAVRDHGDGISPEHLPRVFERFYQANGGIQMGMGLGLYISHQIVDLHGGQIWAESPAGTGTRFVVRLPATTSSSQERRVLLVEDNPDDVKLTLTAFRKCGMVGIVDVAADGVEAMEYLQGTGKFTGRNSNDLPAVILLDLNMPRGGGIELLQKIRADVRTRLVPVVVLTNSNEDKDKLESYGLGANSYVRKPVTFTRFVEAVQQLGLTWLTINSAP